MNDPIVNNLNQIYLKEFGRLPYRDKFYEFTLIGPDPNIVSFVDRFVLRPLNNMFTYFQLIGDYDE